MPNCFIFTTIWFWPLTTALYRCQVVPIYVVRFQQRITCNLYFYQYVKELFSVFPASLQGQAHWPGWVPDNRQFWFDFRWGLRLCRSINDIGDGADGLHSFYQFQILGISFSPPIFIHSLILFQLLILLFQFLYSLFKKSVSYTHLTLPTILRV